MTVLIYVAGLAGLDLPEMVAEAAVVLVVAVAGYVAPHTRRPEVGER